MRSNLSARGATAVAVLMLTATVGLSSATTSQAADAAIIEAAKQEGELVHIDNFFAPESVHRFHDAFRQRYGLPDSFKIQHNTFNSSQVVSRVDQELQAGRLTSDWMLVNAATFWVELHRRGELLEYCSPEYEALTLVERANLLQEGCFFQPAAANTFSIIWNPKFVTDELSSWEQAADPKFAGMVTIGDPRKSEAYLDVFIALQDLMGDEWLRKLAQQNAFFLGRAADMRDRVVSGEYPLWFPGFAQRAYQVRDQIDLKVSYASEGVPVQGMYAGILAQAPRPNAAKLWNDFIFSREGQELIIEIEGVASLREDVEIPDQVKPFMRPIGELQIAPMDWLGLTEEKRDRVREELSDIFGG